MWGQDRRASPCTCALTRMVGATEQLLQLLPWVNQDSPVCVCWTVGGKGAGTLTWEHLSSKTRGCQEQCSGKWISTVALEWGWGIALLALALPPGCVRYPIVILQGPVCVSSAPCACREALLCFSLWFYSGWWWIPFS